MCVSSILRIRSGLQSDIICFSMLQVNDLYGRIRTKETRSRLIIKYYTVMMIGVRSDFVVVAPGND